MPAASAVVADMIDTAVGRAAITFRTLELWSNAAQSARASMPGRRSVYLGQCRRSSGCPGPWPTLASTTFQFQCFSKARDADNVPLVIMTHLTTEDFGRLVQRSIS